MQHSTSTAPQAVSEAVWYHIQQRFDAHWQFLPKGEYPTADDAVAVVQRLERVKGWRDLRVVALPVPVHAGQQGDVDYPVVHTGLRWDDPTIQIGLDGDGYTILSNRNIMVRVDRAHSAADVEWHRRDNGVFQWQLTPYEGADVRHLSDLSLFTKIGAWIDNQS